MVGILHVTTALVWPGFKVTDISFGHLRTMAVVGPALDISVAGGLGEDGVEDVLGDVVAGGLGEDGVEDVLGDVVTGGLGEDGVEDVLGDVVAGIVVVDGYQLTHLGLSSSFKATMGDNDQSGDDTTNSIQSIG